IARDLRGERIERGEMRLVAQLLQELDADAAPVEIAAEIEEERFESRRAAVAHGRVQSEARHSLESASCHAVTFYRKDAPDRRAWAREPHVRGRKTELAAALRAVHHAPGDGVGPAEEARGLGEVGT